MKHKVVANEEYVWQVKNKKQEQVNGSDPVKAMTEFGQKHGTRGEIRITRWQRTGGDMLTSTGVNFKGTFKEVVEKLKHYVSTAVANGGAFKPNWSPTETKLVSILKTLDPVHGIEVKELREKLAGKAWEDLKKIPKPVDQAIENLISAGYMHKIRRGKQWWVKPDAIVKEATSAKKQLPKAPCFPEDATLETAYNKLRKLKSAHGQTDKDVFTAMTRASGVYLDAVSGSRPDDSDVFDALMDFISAQRVAESADVKEAGLAFVVAYRKFKEDYTKFLRSTEATASGKTVQETAEFLLKKHKASYSPEIDVDEKTKAIENALSIVKDLFEGDHCSRLDAAMAIRAAGVLMHKGNKQQSVLGHDVVVKASPSGSATADFVEAGPDESGHDEEAQKPSGSSLLGNAVIGDVKRIQSLIATWSKKKGKGAPPPDQLKEYVAYQKDVAGYIVKTYLSKLPDNYKAKVKAI